MKHVCILLSAYNGEAYIMEQLDSLKAQKGVDISVVVRDDGSSDRTQSILERYQRDGLLSWYSGENKGWADSFMDLLSKAPDADYYAFCDQDDIWIEDKLLRAVECLDRIAGGMKMYCSNLTFFDGASTAGPIRKGHLSYNKYTCLFSNIALGNTIVFDGELRNLVTSHLPKRVPAHDLWVYQCAMYFGTVIYDDESRILYRQHQNNQVGIKRSSWERRRVRISRFFSKSENHSLERSAQLLLHCFGDELSEHDYRIIRNFAYYRTDFKCKCRVLFNGKYGMGRGLFSDMILRLKLALNKK